MYEESQLVETYIDTELSWWQCNRRGDKMKKEGGKLRKEDERRTWGTKTTDLIFLKITLISWEHRVTSTAFHGRWYWFLFSCWAVSYWRYQSTRLVWHNENGCMEQGEVDALIQIIGLGLAVWKKTMNEWEYYNVSQNSKAV